jgi:hypothetical protein
MTTKRIHRVAAPGCFQHETNSRQSITEFAASVKATLEHPQFQANLAVNFRQRTMPDRCLSLCPSISVGMTLPDDSLIFKLVANGDLDGLQSMLCQGNASLRDCNSAGTPLLHVSCPNSHVSRLWEAYFRSMRPNSQKCVNF